LRAKDAARPGRRGGVSGRRFPLPPRKEDPMLGALLKFFGGVIGIIFLIGLLVVILLLALIF
jgi:hypothetical protein